MATPLPELAPGALPLLKPDEFDDPESLLLEEPELELELEEPELELSLPPELEEPELELLLAPELELEALPSSELELLDLVLTAFAWVLPGSTNATAPAAATLATVTPAVMPLTRARPRSRSASATSTRSRFIFLQCRRAVDFPCRQLLRLL